MTDDRSLERAARSWLEAGPTQAPDRAVEAALLRIETTPQERDLWVPRRLPEMTTPARVAAAAIIGVLVVVGAFLTLGPSSPSGIGGPSPSTSPTPSPVATPVAIEEYRAAYDAVCVSARAVVQPLKAQLVGLYDPATPASERTGMIARLADIGTRINQVATDLGAIQPASEVASDHAANVVRQRQEAALIVQEVDLLRAGKLAEAHAIDLSTDPISVQIETFEVKWRLSTCP
jgi:hypothetical protein